MSVILVRAKHIVCRIISSNEAEVLGDSAILVRNGIIEKFGKYEEFKSDGNYDSEIGSENVIVFPGLVNSHHHVGLTPLQLGTPDLALENWINRRLGSKSVNFYLDTLYSAFEMIRSGVTTVQHMHEETPGPIENAHQAATDILRGYKDLGMRVSYGYGVRDQNCLVYEDDRQFAQRLPRALGNQLVALLEDQSIPVAPLDDYVSLFETLVREHADTPITKIQLNPQNLHWCSDKALQVVSDTTRKHDVHMHMHLLETPYQKVYAQKRTGAGSAIPYLKEFDLLGPRLTLGHGTWLTEDDLDLIAETGTCICHNCSSNMRLRSGTAPLNSMRERGINVGLGMDEAGINDDRDMLQEMRLVLRAHRTPGMGKNVPTPNDVFRMASEYGAMTTGFRDGIGSLQVGKAADLVLANWKHIAFPYLDEEVPIVDALVQKARSSGVDSVMVNGQLVLHEGRFVNVDEEAILNEISESLDRPRTEQEARMKKFSQDIEPHVLDFYADYLDGQRFEPYYVMNSKT